MTVLMTAAFDVDATKLEDVGRQDRESLRRISARAKEYGLIAHRFYGNENGVLVVDLWPDEASFQKFYAASPDIAEVMGKAGATSAPQITFYRDLAVDDVVEPATTAASHLMPH